MGAKYTYTSQKAIRAAFWRDNPNASKRRITDYSGKGKMYTTDTRCAFTDYVDYLRRCDAISPELANRVTLER